jgi:hypothetical protein
VEDKQRKRPAEEVDKEASREDDKQEDTDEST